MRWLRVFGVAPEKDNFNNHWNVAVNECRVKYRDIGHDGGVDSYRVTESGLEIRFKNNPTVYSYSRVEYGSSVIDNLTQLAEAGNGLTRN